MVYIKDITFKFKNNDELNFKALLIEANYEKQYKKKILKNKYS